MKTIRTQTLFASFVVAILLLLNISPALAGGPNEAAREQRGISWSHRSRLHEMGDRFSPHGGPGQWRCWRRALCRGGSNIEPTANGDKIDALYHINGGAFHFTAHNHATKICRMVQP